MGLKLARDSSSPLASQVSQKRLPLVRVVCGGIGVARAAAMATLAGATAPPLPAWSSVFKDLTS